MSLIVNLSGHVSQIQKMVTPLGNNEYRSSLKSSWGKCGIWLVDKWILFFLCFCMLESWWHIKNFDTMIPYGACFVVIFIWYLDMLIILIDSIAYLNVFFLVIYSSCSSWHVYPSCCISCSSWYVDSFCCILSCSS